KNDIKEYKVIFTVGSYYDKKYLTCAKNYVQKKDLRNVEFTRCSLKDMIDLYSRASFVALTSFQETLPMSVLEAMSSGTPVLVSNIKPMRYIVEDGVTGLLVDPSNPRDIAEKILLLINDGDLRKKIGLNAKRVAEKRWRSEVVAEKHLKLYEEIVEESDKHV
ncbi:MAG: glycosyltransferase family 4 protein, partial [Ignisphaera sp.]